ncbi:MAG TPA: ABC transporter substrate-binding protein, partial [Stellaceae bacterium]|nr:ABC transporter substrate-binding protein [Stellaceae bacterium]
MHLLRVLAIAVAIVALEGAVAARAEDKVSFGTDWKAEAEHGGYYQAIAAGIYRRHGIEVSLRQGGPQVN